MTPRIRISRVQPYHTLPTIKKQQPAQPAEKNKHSIANKSITEVQYPVSLSYNRPFEARRATSTEEAEILKEKLKLRDGFYQNKNIFFSGQSASKLKGQMHYPKQGQKTKEA